MSKFYNDKQKNLYRKAHILNTVFLVLGILSMIAIAYSFNPVYSFYDGVDLIWWMVFLLIQVAFMSVGIYFIYILIEMYIESFKNKSYIASKAAAKKEEEFEIETTTMNLEQN